MGGTADRRGRCLMMDHSDSVIVRAAHTEGIRALQGVLYAALAGGLLLPLLLLWSTLH